MHGIQKLTIGDGATTGASGSAEIRLGSLKSTNLGIIQLSYDRGNGSGGTCTVHGRIGGSLWVLLHTFTTFSGADLAEVDLSNRLMREMKITVAGAGTTDVTTVFFSE